MFALIRKAERIAKIFTFLTSAHKTYTGAKAWVDKKSYWTITVEPNSELYRIAHPAIFPAETKPPRWAKASILDGWKWNSEWTEGERALRDIGLASQAAQKKTLTIDGQKVEVRLEPQVNKPTTRTDGTSSNSMNDLAVALHEIKDHFDKDNVLRFYTRTEKGQTAVREFLADLVRKQTLTPKKPSIYIATSLGWNEVKTQPPRPLSSVILPGKDLENLRDDFKNFIDSENWYVSRGLPYHRGYVLEGPPGTGKTSIVRALSTDLGLNLYYLSLSEISGDSVLIKLLSGMDNNSILLLEDADVFNSTKQREMIDDKNKLTLSGLLNGLDGVTTPHGLMTILTTNHFDTLDPALIRSGRVGVRLHVGTLTGDQANRMGKWFYSDPDLDLGITDDMVDGMTSAKLTEMMNENPLPQMVSVWLSYRDVIEDTLV